MKELLYTTAKSTFTKVDGSVVWLAILQLGMNKTPEELYAEVARRAHLEISDVKYIVDKLLEVIVSFLKEGYPVLLDWLAIAPAMTGGLETADGQFSRDRNAIVIRTHSRPPLRDCMADYSARNLVEKLKATILSVMDNVAMQENLLTVASKILVVGNNMLINRENVDEGVTLTKKDGEIVATAEILANDSSTIDLAFPELPPDGEYVLVVKARSGATTDYAPAVARRNVTVRAAE